MVRVITGINQSRHSSRRWVKEAGLLWCLCDDLLTWDLVTIANSMKSDQEKISRVTRLLVQPYIDGFFSRKYLQNISSNCSRNILLNRVQISLYMPDIWPTILNKSSLDVFHLVCRSYTQLGISVIFRKVSGPVFVHRVQRLDACALSLSRNKENRENN